MGFNVGTAIGAAAGYASGGTLSAAATGASIGGSILSDDPSQSSSTVTDPNYIQTRVKDAKAAGIHPLYALGAPAATISNTHYDSGIDKMGQGLAAAGTAINQYSQRKQATAFNAAQINKLQAETAESRARAVATRLNAMNASREFTQQSAVNSVNTKVKNMVNGVGQARPGTGLNAPGIGRVNFNPAVDSADIASARYGDLVEALYGLGVLGSDAKYTYGNPVKKAFTKSMYKNKKMYRDKNDPYSKFKKWMRTNKRKYNDNNYWGP